MNVPFMLSANAIDSDPLRAHTRLPDSQTGVLPLIFPYVWSERQTWDFAISDMRCAQELKLMHVVVQVLGVWTGGYRLVACLRC